MMHKNYTTNSPTTKQLNTQSVLNFYQSIERVVNGLVSLIVNIFMFAITTLAPLAAPIAPAFSVYKALSERLETPFAIALAGSIAIEICGLFVSKVAIRATNWNSQRNKTDPIAPKNLAIAMAAIFFSVIFTLSLTIELKPELAVLVYPGFVVIAITCYFAIAVSNNLTAWEQIKTEDLADRKVKTGIKAEIKQAQKDLDTLAANIEKLAFERDRITQDIDRQKIALAHLNGQKNNGQTNGIAKTFGPENINKARAISESNSQQRIAERRQKVLALKSEKLTNAEIANKLGCSLGTIKNDLKELNGRVK